jgi:hypothetical protein
MFGNAHELVSEQGRREVIGVKPSMGENSIMSKPIISRCSVMDSHSDKVWCQHNPPGTGVPVDGNTEVSKPSISMLINT